MLTQVFCRLNTKKKSVHVYIKKPLEFRYKGIVLRRGEFACVGGCVSVYSRRHTYIHESHMHRHTHAPHVPSLQAGGKVHSTV